MRKQLILLTKIKYLLDLGSGAVYLQYSFRDFDETKNPLFKVVFYEKATTRHFIKKMTKKLKLNSEIRKKIFLKKEI